MPIVTPYNFEQIATKIKTTLQQDTTLSYVPDSSIIIASSSQKETIPQFASYLIRIFPADSGFIIKRAMLGQYFRTTYAVAIELWVKSLLNSESRLLRGRIMQNKGIWEFFQDVSNILEHNTFNNYVDPFPGHNVQSPVQLSADEQQLEGVGFIWMGNQDTLQ